MTSTDSEGAEADQKMVFYVFISLFFPNKYSNSVEIFASIEEAADDVIENKRVIIVDGDVPPQNGT